MRPIAPLSIHQSSNRLTYSLLLNAFTFQNAGILHLFQNAVFRLFFYIFRILFCKLHPLSSYTCKRNHMRVELVGIFQGRLQLQSLYEILLLVGVIRTNFIILLLFEQTQALASKWLGTLLVDLALYSISPRWHFDCQMVEQMVLWGERRST